MLLMLQEEAFQKGFVEKDKITKEDTSNGDMSLVSIGEMGYYSVEALAVSSSKSEGIWILDLGCTFHIMPYKEGFVDIKK